MIDLAAVPDEAHFDDAAMNEGDPCLASLNLFGVCLRHLLSNGETGAGPVG
ncbi:MAG: hypothetical protein ACR2ME_06725 [Acidimicrobiia bacterium]